MAILTDTLVNGNLTINGKIRGNTPTAAAGTSTEQIASTEFVTTAIGNITASQVSCTSGTYGGSSNVSTTQAALNALSTAVGGKQATLTFDGTYNASTNKAATVSTVTNAFNNATGAVGYNVKNDSKGEGYIHFFTVTAKATSTGTENHEWCPHCTVLCTNREISDGSMNFLLNVFVRGSEGRRFEIIGLGDATPKEVWYHTDDNLTYKFYVKCAAYYSSYCSARLIARGSNINDYSLSNTWVASVPANVSGKVENGKVAIGGYTKYSSTAGTATTAVNVSTEAGSVNAARHVWFSDSGTETKRNHDDNFKYNPYYKVLSVNDGNVSAATFKLTSGTTSKATMRFNSTSKCIEFVID